MNKNNFPYYHIIVCVIGLFVQTAYQSFVVLSNTSTLFDEECQNFKFLGPDMNGISINASYIAADPWNACSSLHNKENYQGKIVIFSYSGCLPSKKVKHVQEAGGLLAGMLIPYYYYNNLANARFDGSSGIEIPAVVKTILPTTMERHDWLKNAAQSILLKKDTDPSTTFAVVTPDPLVDNTQFWIFFSVIISIFSLINVSMGAFRFYQIVSSTGKFEASLPVICLILEVAANVERVIMCIDPDYSTGWGIYPFSTNVVLQFLNIPWTFSATALIGAYWNRALGHFVQNTHESTNVFHVEKWKIPIAILCFFLIVYGTINASLQGFFVDGEWTFVGECLYIAVCIGVSFYFMVTGIRILLAVRNTTAITKSTERLKKLGILVCVSGFGIALMLAGLITIAANENLWKIYIFFVFFGLNTMSLAKVATFEGTQKAKSTGTQSPPDTRKSTQLPEIQKA